MPSSAILTMIPGTLTPVTVTPPDGGGSGTPSSAVPQFRRNFEELRGRRRTRGLDDADPTPLTSTKVRTRRGKRGEI